jgi:hypothetical protein
MYFNSYTPHGSHGTCVATSLAPVTTRPDPCNGFYLESSGYRLVGGDSCRGGLDRRPRVLPCGGLVLGTVTHSGAGLLLVFGIIALALAAVTAFARIDRVRECVGAVRARFGAAGGAGGYKLSAHTRFLVLFFIIALAFSVFLWIIIIIISRVKQSRAFSFF